MLKRQSHFLIFAIALLAICEIAAAQESTTTSHPPIPTAEELFTKLNSTVDRLRNVRVIASDRFENRGTDGQVILAGDRWHHLFLNGDSAQAWANWENVPSPKPGWFVPPVTTSIPLTTTTIATVKGLVTCYRPAGA